MAVQQEAGSQIKRIVHVSTDEVYGGTKPDSDSRFLESESPLDPTNPYSGSKAAAEMIVKAYKKSFRLPIIVTRGNNVRVHMHVCVCVYMYTWARVRQRLR